MGTLVFDIETVGEVWDNFDEYTKRQLVRSSGEKSEEAAKNQLGLSPLTGSVVSLAMYDVERHQGAVYVVGSELKIVMMCS
jgi:hypothetical protein